jgi:hypothetical protein
VELLKMSVKNINVRNFSLITATRKGGEGGGRQYFGGAVSAFPKTRTLPPPFFSFFQSNV